ncbi:hypothetical protein [Cohnella sp. AR92]|uniref:hypothetical protein n=1 Tax=Cohnella sp. AR92 TaxID=648716 RepID=UPI000F8C6DE8|nr:hypothetical protein [Cohnella sp. AR92]RUS45299.1 hypothetical protein ELR57_20550 [Cohnella sp. AR92]
MIERWQRFGSLLVRLRFVSANAAAFTKHTIGDQYVDVAPGTEPDYSLTLEDGYGENYDEVTPVGYEKNERGDFRVSRADFLVESTADLREAHIRFYNYFGLRTALLNWYSRILSRLDWGMLIHSSCIVQDGQAYLFSGYSGAGKSTIASMSQPRPILADETTVVEIRKDGRILIHDSPFRNDFKEPYREGPVPLKGIYLIKQSLNIEQHRMTKSDAMFALFDKIVHWRHENADTIGLIRLSKTLVDRVPVYELEFQKNDRFWEAIS